MLLTFLFQLWKELRPEMESPSECGEPKASRQRGTKSQS
jgi:hypothetical protein